MIVFHYIERGKNMVVEKHGYDKVAVNFGVHRYIRDKFVAHVRGNHDGSMASLISKFMIAYTEGIITIGHLEGHRDTPKRKEVHIPVLSEATLDELQKSVGAPVPEPDPEPQAEAPQEPEMTAAQARAVLKNAGFSDADLDKRDWSGFKQ